MLAVPVTCTASSLGEQTALHFIALALLHLNWHQILFPAQTAAPVKSQTWSQPSRHAAATKDVGGSETVALRASSAFERQGAEAGKTGEGWRSSDLQGSYAASP